VRDELRGNWRGNWLFRDGKALTTGSVLSRIIRDHAPPGLTITERNLAEEIDQVVTRTLARPWDNADARSRGVRRATAAVFRRYMLKPVRELYDSTVAYIEAHYLVD